MSVAEVMDPCERAEDPPIARSDVWASIDLAGVEYDKLAAYVAGATTQGDVDLVELQDLVDDVVLALELAVGRVVQISRGTAVGDGKDPVREGDI